MTRGPNGYGSGAGKRVGSAPKFCAQKKWGPALLPAPTAPSEGSAGVRNLVDKTFRPTYPLSILAHQLRRRFPSCSALFRGARLIYLTTWPEGSLVFRLARPGAGTSIRRLNFRPIPPDVPRPFLGQSLPRPASLTFPVPSEEVGGREPRRTTGRLSLPAPLPGWPREEPKLFPLPAGGDRTFGHLPHPPAVAGSWGGRDRRPDHPWNMHLGFESRKQNIW
jgi:hypothetical protein